MNKILRTTAICLGAFALAACNDWLDTDSPSLQNEATVFNNETETQYAVYGLYSSLCADAYTQLMTIHQGTGTDVELIDGIGATATGQNSERDGMNYNATTSWAKLGTLWEVQFSTIEKCNRIIDGIKGSSIANNDNMMRYSAEARVIRAMVYLDLIRVFGDVPMMLQAANSDLSNVNVGKTDRDVILDALIADMENVVKEDKLPWCGPSVSSEHINMGYAKGLLANLYMTRAGYAIREDSNTKAVAGNYSSQQKLDNGYIKADYSDGVFMTVRPSDADCAALYAKAEQQLKDIIIKGIHKMNPSFANEWELINKLELDQTYYENMFEIPMGFGNTGELGYTVGVRMNGNTIDWGNYNSSGKMKTTAVMLYSYQPCDTRRDITCVNMEIKDYTRTATQSAEEKEKYSGGKDVVTIESRLSNKPFALYIGKWDVRKMSSRWKSQNLTASSKFGYGINVVRMRYPQILLWYAECLAYRGDYSTAGQYVKDVHNRAFNDAKETYQGSMAATTPAKDKQNFADKVDAATDYESFLDIIDLENKLEFCGENFRKWDLIRWNRLHANIWKAKQKYNELKTNKIFQTKIFYKYTDDTEKYIDASSITWYGENGTNEIAGTDIATGAGGNQDNEWLSNMGYHTTKEDYNPGHGASYKGLNGDSYSTAAFGTDYANYDTEMPSICSGLVGTQKNCNSGMKCNDEGVTVKNRYLMPIYSNVVNSSIGSDQTPRVYNSYGY